MFYLLLVRCHQSNLNVEIDHQQKGRFGLENSECLYNRVDTSVRKEEHMEIYSFVRKCPVISSATYFSSVGSFSGVYQDTSMTLLYSSRLSIGIGI
jgi:hypothetical protein